jgi:NADPH2:quinone reductase
LPIPIGFSFAEAAALPETWFTVWANLAGMAHLSDKDSLLVHGGSSGIGLTAIQFAKIKGVQCIVTAGNDEKVEFCKAFGASGAINYRTEKVSDRVLEITKGQGVDVILDMVGAPYLNDNIKLLRKDGRLIMIGFLGGSRSNLNFLQIMLKRLNVTGSTMRSRAASEKQSIRDALREEIWPVISNEGLKPHVFKTFPLGEVSEAHKLMESSEHIGKIVLEVSKE